MEPCGNHGEDFGLFRSKTGGTDRNDWLKKETNANKIKRLLKVHSHLQFNTAELEILSNELAAINASENTAGSSE